MTSKRGKKYCSVFGCLNNDFANPDLSFFILPTQPEMSTPTPKQLLKSRVGNNKNIKVLRDECSRKMLSETRIEPLHVIHNYKKKYFKTRDRELKDDPYHNPYAMPERLRVTTTCLPPRKEKSVPFIMGEIHTVCDIDPMFYAIIEGRPIRSFYDIKAYMRDIRDITLFRANAGYLKDKIIQIDVNSTYEEEQFEKISKYFKLIKESFVIYVEESYKEAKRMQNLAEEKEKQVAIVTEELESYSFEFVKLKNEISNIVAIYEYLLRYKKFLNQMAPAWWRVRYDEFYEIDYALCANLFSQLETNETVESYKKSALSLSQLQPQLYFKTPMELISALDDMSRQCLNYMEIATYFSAALNKVNTYRELYKEEMIDQYTDMQDIIENFENQVKILEETRDSCKAKFYKILENEFYKLIASYDSVMLFTCVQYAHTHLFGVKEDPRDKLTSLMRNIESLYSQLSSKLEVLNQQVVKEATNQIFNEDKRIMKQAYDAQRHLKEYQVLCKALYASFEPSRRKTRY